MRFRFRGPSKYEVRICTFPVINQWSINCYKKVYCSFSFDFFIFIFFSPGSVLYVFLRLFKGCPQASFESLVQVGTLFYDNFNDLISYVSCLSGFLKSFRVCVSLFCLYNFSQLGLCLNSLILPISPGWSSCFLFFINGNPYPDPHPCSKIVFWKTR